MVHSSWFFTAILYYHLLTFLAHTEYGCDYSTCMYVHSYDSGIPAPSASNSSRPNAQSQSLVHSRIDTTRRSVGENEHKVKRDDHAFWKYRTDTSSSKEADEENKSSIKIKKLESAFNGVGKTTSENSFDHGVDSAFDGVESAFNGVDSAFDGVESAFNGVDSAFDDVESAFDGTHLSSNHRPMKAFADRAFINVTYFKIDENVTVLPDLDNDTVPYRKGLIRAINFTDTGGMFATSERYISVGAAFEGHLVFPYAGIWTFYLTCDDGGKFMIGNNEIIDNDGIHVPEEKSGTYVVDSAGQVEAFKLLYFQQSGNSALILKWSAPSQGERKKEIIPVSKCAEEDFVCWIGGFGSSRFNSTSQINFVDGPPSSQPTVSPAPTKKMIPSFVPCESSPSFTPTIATSVPNLVTLGKDGRRRFPPELDPSLLSFNLENHYGRNFTRTLLLADHTPKWAGKMHSICKRNQMCSLKYPKSNDAISITRDIVTQDNVGFLAHKKKLPGGDNFSTRSIVVADVNNDGRLDLIIGNYDQPNQLLIQRRGSANLEFDVLILPGGNTSTEEIAVADMDFDGYVDIVVGNYGGPNEVLWNENGTGIFSTYELPGGNSYTGTIALGDIYGSGNIDIIIGNIGQPNYILKNSGDRSRKFEKLSDNNLPQDDAYTQAIAVASIVTDAEEVVQYIIVGNTKGPNQLLKWTIDDATFHEVQGALPQDHSDTMALAVADFDGDGMFEIVVGNFGDSNQLLFFAGNHKFEERNEAFPVDNTQTKAISVADIDGDGKLDIIAGNLGQANQIIRNKIVQTTNTTDIRFKTLREALPNDSLDTWAVGVGDMNGNGRVDILTGNDDQETMLLFNEGGGKYGEIAGALPGSLNTRVVISGDFTGDNKTDIIIGNTYGEPNLLLQNNGFGEFEKIELGGRENSAWAIAFGDFGNNGRMDIVIANNWGQDNTIMLNQGDGSFGEELPLPGGAHNTISIAVADLNNDGRMDIVIGNYWQKNQILLNKGNGSFGIPLFDVQFLEEDISGTSEIRVADVNDDGHVDIIIGDYFGLNRVLFLKNGTFYKHADLPGKYVTETIAVADLDADGAIDIIVGNDGEANQILWNDGNGNFVKSQQLDTRSTTCKTTSIIVADIYGNGLADIIVGNDGEANEILFNDGNRSFRQERKPGSHIPGSSSNTASIAVGDVDGDGFIDFIIGNHGGIGNQLILYDPCPNGGARIHGGSWCFGCPTFMGRPMSNGEELSICRECIPDYIQEPGHGERCDSESCPFGFRELGKDTCNKCEAGTSYNKSLARSEFVKSSWDQPRCETCPEGTRSDGDFPYECFECDRGTYKNFTGKGDCVVCEPGKFQPKRGQTECKLCEAGGYCNSVDSENGGFTPCDPGFYNNKTGQSNEDTCIPCDPGYFSVFSQRGAKECAECMFGLNSTSGSEACSFCGDGFYLAADPVPKSALSHNPSKYCKECPSNAICISNTSIQTLSINPGFWRDSNKTSKLYRCPNINLCEDSAASNLYKCSINTEMCEVSAVFGESPYCKSGYKGPLCQSCENANEYFRDSRDTCERCPPVSKFILTLILVVTLIIGIAFLVRIAVRSMPTIGTRISSFSLRAKLKIIISFYQVVSSLEVVYGVEVHSSLKDLFNFFDFDALDLDLSDYLNYPVSCIGSMAKRLVFYGIGPYVFIIFSISILLLVRKIFRQPDNTKLKKPSLLVVQFTIIVLYFVLPMVSQRIFEAKKCRAFETEDGADGTAAKSNSYLVAEMDIECRQDDPQFARLGTLFWVFFVIWPIFTPLLIGFVLKIISKSVRANSPTRLADSCRFLWEDYTNSMICWDVIDTFRKIVLTGVIMLSDTEEGSNKLVRLIVASIISSIYLGILATARPYKRDDNLYLAIISNIILTCCFGMGIILKLCNGDDDDDPDGNCVSLIGSDTNSFRVSIVVLAFTIGMLAMTILALVLIARNLIKAPIVRLVRTGYPPIMEMPKHCAYHVFMSHMWATGQAKTHAIARKLQLFLPQLRLWLDVDQLQEMADLENSVSESTVFILFYSEGYFRSKNCRRELYAAVSEDKPMIVVYEGDDSVIEELKLECVSNCTLEPGSAYILEHMFQNEPIRWLDQGAFSAVSMKMIYTCLLANLPHYEKPDNKHILEGGLSVPGEFHQLPLHNSLTIIVCEGNEGALQVAQELKDIPLPQNDISIETVSNDTVLEALSSSFEEDDEGLISQGLLKPSNQKSAFLLYLNKDTFLYDNGTLKNILKSATESKIDIILVHEIDVSNGGSDFGLFFKQTPYELIDSPYELYNEIAIPLYSTAEFRAISLFQILRRIDTGLSTID